MDQAVEPITIFANGNKYSVKTAPNVSNHQRGIQEQENTSTSQLRRLTNNEENANQATDNEKNHNWKEVAATKK